MMQVSRISLYVAAWSILLFLFAPGLVTIPLSFTPERFLSLPNSLSLRHYANFFTNPLWLTSAFQSLFVGIMSSVIAVLFGTLCSIGLWRTKSKHSEKIRALILLPIIIPSIVSALVFYRLLLRLGLLDTFTGVILAHAILSSPYVVITVSASLANFDSVLERASASLGASPIQTLMRVTLPSIRTGILAGGVFAFVASWDELVVTLFITRFDIFTLPRRMWDGMRENVDPTVAAAASLLMLVSIGGVLLAWLIKWNYSITQIEKRNSRAI